MKYFLLACVLAVAFCGTCKSGADTLDVDELNTLHYENTLEEVTLANTGGTIIDDGSIWGQWQPDASSAPAFWRTVQRVTEKAQTIDSVVAEEKCLIDGVQVYPYCLIDCKVDYGIQNCQADVAMFKSFFDDPTILKQYCIQPRLDAIKAGTLNWDTNRCYYESCPCRNFKNAIINHPDGKIYQARLYARVVAYQTMCQNWCATGQEPQRTWNQ